MSDFSEGDTLKLVLFSDSHGNVANMADVVRLYRLLDYFF